MKKPMICMPVSFPLTQSNRKALLYCLVRGRIRMNKKRKFSNINIYTWEFENVQYTDRNLKGMQSKNVIPMYYRHAKKTNRYSWALTVLEYA